MGRVFASLEVHAPFWPRELLGTVHKVVKRDLGTVAHGTGVRAPVPKRGEGASGPRLLLGCMLTVARPSGTTCTAVVRKAERSSAMEDTRMRPVSLGKEGKDATRKEEAWMLPQPLKARNIHCILVNIYSLFCQS